MAKRDILQSLSGEILEENTTLTLAELCWACQLPAQRIFELVEEGIIEPQGRSPASWQFQGVSVRRVRCVRRLERDLGLNVAGAALAIELLEELERLRARLRRLEG